MDTLRYTREIRQEQHAIDVDLMLWTPFIAVSAHYEVWVYCGN